MTSYQKKSTVTRAFQVRIFRSILPRFLFTVPESRANFWLLSLHMVIFGSVTHFCNSHRSGDILHGRPAHVYRSSNSTHARNSRRTSTSGTSTMNSYVMVQYRYITSSIWWKSTWLVKRTAPIVNIHDLKIRRLRRQMREVHYNMN